jgi:acyl-CoA synthetase (AMP-forming)/AMP-acid ligase II
MRSFSTLRDLVRDRANQRPRDLAYAFLSGNEIQNQWNYADLQREVGRVGGRLNKFGAKGQRVLLVYPQGLDFLAAFLACLCWNVVAVPVPAPEAWNLRRAMPRLRAIAQDANAAFVLTTRKILNLVSAIDSAWDSKVTPWIATDEVIDDPVSDLGDEPIPVSELAYLQYTSGSTSSPSGVMLSHQNLIHHLNVLHAACGYGNGVTVSWMPHFHDYGLVQGLLQPLFSGDPCYFMSALSFLKRPIHWLGAIAKYGGTHSQGPNFAYDHCVRRILPAECVGLNLASWIAAGYGAEPINPRVLERFVERFEPFGFRKEAFAPAFGLAEATLVVSSTTLNSGPKVFDADAEALEIGRIVPARIGRAARKIVGCGEPLAGTKVAIVNPESLSKSPDDEIGEIWVSGPAVAAGYWNQPDKSRATFGAYLSDSGEGPWMRTGDLGFLSSGQLFVCGRLKDMIIIRGANFAPQDIEWVAQKCHPAVEHMDGAAFSSMIDGEERLVVLQEFNKKDRLENISLEEVAVRIREDIAQEFEIRVYGVALIKRGAILKTSSGKIQRRACRAALLNGSLETVFVLSDGPLSPLPSKLPENGHELATA